MLGLFDSGSGGLNTVRYIKANLHDIDLVYKIDRANAPYGIKSEKELIEIVENNVHELQDRGAEKILIACCTASTVHDKLANEYKSASIPIIKPISKRAMRVSKTGRIGVIATDRTVSKHAFRDSMPYCSVSEIASQELVKLIDDGLNDNTVTEKEKQLLSRIISPLKGKHIDTLILGCTHFPALKLSFSEICRPIGIKHIIDSAIVGAEAIRNSIE